MKNYPLLFIAIVFFLGCSQNNNTGILDNDTTTTQEAPTPFIPVTAILHNQLASLDSLPVTILQIKTINKKEDSTWLPAAQVKPLLQPFLSPVIDKENLMGLFKETKFNDQTTATVTFMYDPKNTLPDSLALRRWDVYYDPEKNAIQRIYIIKQVKENNVPITQQLTWQAGKWAKIVLLTNDKNAQNPIISETKWIWDLDEK